MFFETHSAQGYMLIRDISPACVTTDAVENTAALEALTGLPPS